MRAMSPMVKNFLRFDAVAPAVPWKLPNKFELTVRRYLCTHPFSIAGTIKAVMDVENV